MREIAGVLVALAMLSDALPAQSVLDRSPNMHGTWGVQPGNAAFVFVHRFEFLSGGDQLINIPTLNLALGLPLGFTAGLEYTSNSEIDPTALGENETEYWLKRPVRLGSSLTVAPLIAYNRRAGSVDGAAIGTARVGPLALVGELRGFSDLFGSDEAGFAGALGAILRVTPFLGVSADVGKVLSVDSFSTVWSGGVAVAIPGTPHTFSLHATNGGATTLQAASRDKAFGPESRRYGFSFTVPLGNGSQWARIFRPATATPGATAGTIRVDMRSIAYLPAELHIRAGQTVEWVNFDPVIHTVTGDGWGSEVMPEGAVYSHRFDQPGRFPYRCLPHPQMTGVVIVDPA